MSWQDTYRNTPATPITQATDVSVVPPAECDVAFDWDKILILDDIREHTKTDDVPSVTDRQLMRYRRAAIEAAEQYTGMMLAGQKTLSEMVEAPRTKRALIKGFYNHNLQYQTADGVIHLYGSRDKAGNRTIHIPVGTRQVRIPLIHDMLDVSSCCRPGCEREPHNYNMRVMYRAGFKDCDCVPAGIVVGMLKFIAWNIMHPGDEYLAVADKQRTRGDVMTGTNNVAWASGAIELWRQYDASAI